MLARKTSTGIESMTFSVVGATLYQLSDEAIHVGS